MLQQPATQHLHNNPDAYWCADCWRWTLDCAHLAEPLGTPTVEIDHPQYGAATWASGILEVTMNTGERYQFFSVPRWMAVALREDAGSRVAEGVEV